MSRSRVAAVSAGAAAVVAAIISFYMISQASEEREYIGTTSRILLERNNIVNTFIGELLPRMEAKQLSIEEGMSRVTALASGAANLHHEAMDMKVPDKYRAAHEHLVKGLGYFTASVESTNMALERTDSALRNQNIQSSAVLGAIFGFGSGSDFTGMPEVQSDIEAAKKAFNEAVKYFGQSEEELQLFSSMANVQVASQQNMFEPTTTAATPEQYEECKQLGIPAFQCDEKQILSKKRLGQP
jgi:hypothetical protein